MGFREGRLSTDSGHVPGACSGYWAGCWRVDRGWISDGEDREEVSDPLLVRELVGEGQIGMDRVVVAAAPALARDVAGGGELVTMLEAARSVIPTRSPISRRRMPGSCAMQRWRVPRCREPRREGSSLGRNTAERLERHLAALGVPRDVKTYDKAGHSFFSRVDGWQGWLARIPTPLAAGYHEAAANDGWRGMLAFFDEHVRSASGTAPRAKDP